MDYSEAIAYLKENDIRKDDGELFFFKLKKEFMRLVWKIWWILRNLNISYNFIKAEESNMRPGSADVCM